MPLISSEGGGSGGASVAGPTVGLSNSGTFDIHAHATVAFTWNLAYDNVEDSNPVVVMPSGLGLTVDLTGVSGDLVTTARGTWSYNLNVYGFVVDATLAGQAQVHPDYAGFPFIATAGSALDKIGEVGFAGVVSVPSGTALAPRIFTSVAATANPYPVGVIIWLTRLA